MKISHKHTYSAAACILSIALAVSMLSGCSKGIGVALGKNNKTTPTPSAETTPTPTDVTSTPTDGGTATPTDGTTTTPSNTATASPTKKATPAPTISQSDKGTKTVVEGGSAPVSTTVTPQASGSEVYKNDKAAIDASHKADGYIMVKYTGGSGYKIKLRITIPDGTVYTYNLNSSGNYETFPLSGGNGSYTVKVYRNVSGTSYATDFSQAISVTLKDQFAPFLHANQYVNYTSSSQAVAVARQITSGCSSTLDKVKKVYSYVATNISYDYDKANSVSSGYLPNIDNVLATKKGICFDYAALMTAMLRSQNIPTKLVVGYAGSAYHAWISVYTSNTGWIDGVIYFDGKSWEIMDPTFASTGGSEVIKNTTYSAKYLY
jgi:transglutaminase-like putative cysteine protease